MGVLEFPTTSVVILYRWTMLSCFFCLLCLFNMTKLSMLACVEGPSFMHVEGVGANLLFDGISSWIGTANIVMYVGLAC